MPSTTDWNERLPVDTPTSKSQVPPIFGDQIPILMMRLTIILLATALLSGCSQTPKTNAEAPEIPDAYGHITDDNIKSILKRAIDKAGGIEQWSSIKTIKYTKHNMLFLEDGSTEVDNVQRHEYVMQPAFEATITWEKDSVSHRIEYGPGVARKIENGKTTEADPSATVMSAIYVLGMPYKLLDAGTVLTHKGVVELDSGKRADEIMATYDPGEHDNHSTQDEWYYYFDVEDGTFYGAMVYHAPTYAYIQNLAFDTSSPVQFHAHRKSYRSDSARNIQFLRAEFWYSDYEVEMVN